MSSADRACYLHDIATAVPPEFAELPQTLAYLRQFIPGERALPRVRRILEAAGVRKRHFAALRLQADRPEAERLYPPFSTAPDGPTTEQRLAHFDDLAVPLIDDLLAQLPRDIWSDIRRLITVNCTSAASPGLERLILRGRPIHRRADRWNIGFMGCSAGLAGLRLTRQLQPMADHADAAALIVALELSSLHVQYSERVDQIVANALFADGAAAAVVSPRPGPVRVVDCQCVTLDKCADQMTWTAGNHGFALQLSIELPATLAAAIRPAMSEFLGDNGLNIADVAHWAIHPGGPKIIESVCAALGLSPDVAAASRTILADYGNMSSATIFFILRRLLDSGAAGPIVAVAFGPGLTIELALLDVSRSNLR